MLKAPLFDEYLNDTYECKPCSINVEWQNKASREQLVKHGNDFSNCEITRYDLARFIHCGFAFCSQYKDRRKKDNFVSTGFVALDFDEWNLAEAIAHQYIRDHASIVYTTPTHSMEQHRFRVVFELEKPVTNSHQFEQLIKGLMTIFPQADRACKDCIRIFNGSVNCEPMVMDGWISRKEMTRLILITTSHRLNSPTNVKVMKSKSVRPSMFDEDREISFSKARELLMRVDSKPGYDVWRNICWAIYSKFGRMGKSLIEGWSPDYKTSGYEIDKLFEKYDGRIKIGTLIYYATHGV